MSIEIYFVGDKIFFNKYRVNCEIPRPPTRPLSPRELRETLWWKFIMRLGRYRIEDNCILCDNEEELNDIESALKELGIPYTITNIAPTPEQIARAKEIDGRIVDRNEALNYILKGIMPPRLQREKETQQT